MYYSYVAEYFFPSEPKNNTQGKPEVYKGLSQKLLLFNDWCTTCASQEINSFFTGKYEEHENEGITGKTKDRLKTRSEKHST